MVLEFFSKKFLIFDFFSRTPDFNIIFKSSMFLSIISSIMIKDLSDTRFIMISLSVSKKDLLTILSLNLSTLAIISLS